MKITETEFQEAGRRAAASNHRPLPPSPGSPADVWLRSLLTELGVEIVPDPHPVWRYKKSNGEELRIMSKGKEGEIESRRRSDCSWTPCGVMDEELVKILVEAVRYLGNIVVDLEKEEDDR